MLGRRQLLISALALAVAGIFIRHAAAEGPASEPILGFSTEGAAAEHALEARLDASLNAANLRAWMQRITSHPHHVGSPWDKSNAEFMAGLFRSWGYQTEIEQFKVLFPT
ncbi:MAG TPA: folate hydrolase, partial [Thermoanaerobaculia bacterium]|nr:folate hydrolase [Thermoanaerobaculia bacterium]